MKFNRSFRFLIKLIPYPELKGPYAFMEWKNRLLFVMLAGSVFLGLFAYIPSVVLALVEQIWSVVIIDTLVYAAVIYTAFSRRMSSGMKVKVILITFYFLGIALLILLGQQGAGFNWLFLFPLFSSFFYGYRGIVVSTTVNVISLSLLFIPVYFELEGFGLISQYNKGGWIVNSVNFIAISTLISLALAVMKYNEGKKVAEFYVKDTGRGIPEKDHELIFNRFSQAGNVEFHEGTGLGLSITKGLLDLLDGEIRMNSKPGVGSEFYFTLPADDVKAEEFEENKESNAELHQITGFEDKLVYIAEDDDFSYTLLFEMLRPLKLNIQQALNGKELLEMMEQTTPDIILLDIRMPVMTGLEALVEIRKSHPDLPVIAQSAHVLPEERQKCFEQGCNDYIAKPVNQEKLFALFYKYLDRH